jgi:hypothetical protein
MTDAEIEQERQRIEPPLGPLYVDSKADERSAAIFRELVRCGVVPAITGMEPEDWPYEGDGSIARPFKTLDEARDAQQDGQDIIIAGYATIGRRFAAPNIPDNIKERCS